MPFIESCTTEEICTAFGVSEKLLSQLRNELEDWLKFQPHLPQGASERRLESFILGTKMSLEQAKQKLDKYYTLRGLVPEFFINRDPRGPDLTALRNSIQYVGLPKLTAEKYTITIFRSFTKDIYKTDPWQISKYMFMINDIQFDECRSLGHIYIFDLVMMSLGHLKTVTPTFLQKCFMAAKAYPVRIKHIHYINAPSFVEPFVSMIKSIVSPKIAARVHVHSSGNMESFYRLVPKSVLPKDYGGDQPTMDELSDMWSAKMDEWRDSFLEENKAIVNERLRPGSATNSGNFFGFPGSFRKLDID